MTFSVATNEYRGGNGERTEYHACVAWDHPAETMMLEVSDEQ